MLFEYSFRKSFLISSPSLKPDEQPIQQLLPPQIPSGNLARTYSFSQLNNNKHDSFKEELSELSLEVNQQRNKVNEELVTKIQHLQNELAKQKHTKLQLIEQNSRLKQDYQTLLIIHNLKQKDTTTKQEKQQLTAHIKQLQKQLQSSKQELRQRAEQLTTYQGRSEESRRLLQKLNENINKKESKLLKDKEIIQHELDNTKKLLEESIKREEQIKEKMETKDKYIDELRQHLQRERNEGIRETQQREQMQKSQLINKYESALKEKNNQRQQMLQKIQELQSQYEREVTRFTEQKHSSYTKIEYIEKSTEEQINYLQLRLSELQQENVQLQEKLTAVQEQYENSVQVNTSRINKLEIQVTNGEYYNKEKQQQLNQLLQQHERMNVTLNELREDKRNLIKKKEELKTWLNQKTATNQQLKARIEQARELELRHSSIIQSYQKDQQHIYHQQARQTETIATLEIKVKSSAIEYEKLTLKLSEKQEEINKLTHQLEKYKKLYKKEKQTLQMYKQQTTTMREKTEHKWKELRLYYQSEIQNLEDKIAQLESLSTAESRSRIRNSVFYSGHIAHNSDGKTRISTSRVTGSVQKGQLHYQDTARVRDRRTYKRTEEDDGFKENYWQGLNNDFVDHEPDHIAKG